MLNEIEGIDLPFLTVAERALADNIQQLENTLSNLRLNHPKITQSEMDLILKYVNASIRQQIVVDKKECDNKMQGYNPPNPPKDKPSSFIVPTTPSTYKINTVKTGGINRKIIEFVTSERHAIGIYKRCVSDIEGMDSAVEKLKAMPHESKLTHKKVKLYESYSKHYKRFQVDHAMLKQFKNLKGDLKEQFEHSHDSVGRSAWEENLEDWDTPGYPKTPADYKSIYKIRLD